MDNAITNVRAIVRYSGRFLCVFHVLADAVH